MVWGSDATGCEAPEKLGGQRTGPQPISGQIETPSAERVDGAALLVSAWRRMASGNGTGSLVTRAFAAACGDDGAEVLATFDAFLRALAWAARRRLRIGYPGAADLTIDEQQALALIAAGQAGHATCFDAHLRWLARPDAAAALGIAARALGTALAAHGYRLPLALRSRPASDEVVRFHRP
jgi:hypothetical protein